METEINEKMKFKNVFIIMGVVIFVLGTMFFAKVVSEENNKGEAAREYNEGWYYKQENEIIPVSLPFDIDLKEEEIFTIYNDTIAEDNAGGNLFIKNAIYRPEMYLDNTLIYQYMDGGLRRNPPELSYQLCIGEIKDNIRAGTLKIVFHKSNDNIISLPKVYVASTDTIVRNLYFSNAYISVITITMIMLGFFVLLIEIITRKQNYEYKKKLLMLGFFLLTTGIWCFTDSPFVQYLFGYSNVNMYADFFIFMFLPIPFIGYVISIKGMEKYKSINCIILVCFCNIIIQTILELLNIFTYIKMVPVTHLLIVVTVITSIFLLCMEYRDTKNREVFVCLRAFASAGIFAIFSIMLYFMKPELFYQNLFQTGLLLFVLVLLWNVVSDFIESLKYKTEANIYKLLAEVDKLTNLKNRRGFDLKLSEIEKNIDKYDNILLIFIDVNGLKKINDSYGHTKGDEMIMAAAGCIEGAYKNHGFCYRIGGDEFCAIIENPLFSDLDAIKFVEHEVENYNEKLSGDCHLSIAIGSSLLREINGTMKKLAIWREEADNKMYENKKEKKLREIE